MERIRGNALLKIKKVHFLQDPTEIVNKAVNIYQKFLAPNAYIQVDGVPAKISNKIGAAIGKIARDEAVFITNKKLFNKLNILAEARLENDLFKPFFKSRFYVIYKRRSALIDVYSK